MKLFELMVWTGQALYGAGPLYVGHLMACWSPKLTHKKQTYRTYLGVDASAVNLLRPAMYGLSHITIWIDLWEDRDCECCRQPLRE